MVASNTPVPITPLEAALRRLDGMEVTVRVVAENTPAREAELFARFLAALNRPGGPRISSRAIDNR